MTANKFESRSHLVASIVEHCLATGFYSDERHEITASSDYVIWVKEISSGKNVAYSSTKADFEMSLVEFATDYFS